MSDYARRFEGRTAIVTGGAQGIGEAICRRIGLEGGAVYIADFNAEAGLATAEMLQNKNIDVRFVPVNVADRESITEMVGEVAEQTKGNIHVLINNAGITRDKSALGMSGEYWDDVLATHLNGTFFTSQAVARVMVKKALDPGEPLRAIVNASSVSFNSGNPGQANYTAAKGAIVGLTRTLSDEWAPKGIRVNAVAPGITDTNMAADMTPEALDRMESLVPLGRMAHPDEIASSYAFLASDDASYITGIVLPTDGGLILPAVFRKPANPT